MKACRSATVAHIAAPGRPQCRLRSGWFTLAVVAGALSASPGRAAEESVFVIGRSMSRTAAEVCAERAMNDGTCLERPSTTAMARGAARAALFEPALRAKGDARTIIGLRAALSTLGRDPVASSATLLAAKAAAEDRYDRLATAAAGKQRIPVLDGLMVGLGEGVGAAGGAAAGGGGGVVTAGILASAGAGAGGALGLQASDAIHVALDPGNRFESSGELIRSDEAQRRYGFATVAEVFALADQYPALRETVDVALNPYGVGLGLDIEGFGDGLQAANPLLVLPELGAAQMQTLEAATSAQAAGTASLALMENAQGKLQELLDTQVEMRDSAATAEAKAIREAEDRLRKQTLVEGTRGALLGLQSVLALSDPKAARDLGIVSDGALQVYDTIAKFSPMLDQSGGLASLAAVGMTGNLVGVAVSFVALTQDQGPSPEAMILEQLAMLREQIAAMEKMIRENFEHVDIRFDEISDLMVENFDLVIDMLENDADRSRQIEANTFALRNELRLAISDIRGYIQDLARLLAVNEYECSEQFPRRLQGTAGAERQTRIDEIWYECTGGVINFIRTGLNTGMFAGQPIEDTDDVAAVLKNFGFGQHWQVVPALAGVPQQIATLRSIAAAMDAVPVMAGDTVPNPALFAIYAEYYLHFALAMEQELASIPDFLPRRGEETGDVIESGERVEALFDALSPVGQPALYLALIEAYRARVEAFAAALVSLRRGYEGSNHGLKGWTWEQFGWGSPTVDLHPAVDLRPAGDVKSIGEYYPGLARPLRVKQCGRVSQPYLQMPADQVMPIIRAADRLIAPLHELASGKLLLCHRQGGPRRRADNPFTTERNADGSYTWYRTSGHPRIEVVVYETDGRRGRDRFVARYERRSALRLGNVECPTPRGEEGAEAVAEWERNGGPQPDPYNGCRNRWRKPHVDVVADFNNSNGQNFSYLRNADRVPSLGTSPAERSSDLRTLHEAKLEAVTRIAILGPEYNGPSLDPEDILEDVLDDLVEERAAVAAAAVALFEHKALILAMLSLGAPDLLAADATLARPFYGAGPNDRLIDPVIMLEQLERPVQNPLMHVLWMRNSAKRRADELAAYFEELGGAGNVSEKIALNSEFARVVNDLRVLQALQMDAAGLLQ